MKAIDAVKNKGTAVEMAQADFVGCTLEDVIRSHAVVFAAEEARKSRRVIDWAQWWKAKVEDELKQ